MPLYYKTVAFGSWANVDCSWNSKQRNHEEKFWWYIHKTPFFQWVQYVTLWTQTFCLMQINTQSACYNKNTRSKVILVEEQRRCSGESTFFPPMWPRFNSSPVLYVGWVYCWFSPHYKGFSPGPLVFLLPQKPTLQIPIWPWRIDNQAKAAAALL